MHRNNVSGKKRRCDVLGDVEAERTLYSSFVTAANAMSQLYSQAVQQQRRSAAAASRQTLERVLGFLVRECSNTDMVPKAALLQFLQQEYENIDGSESMPQQFPVQFLPTIHAQGAAPAATMDDQTSPEPQHKTRLVAGGGAGGGLMSPTPSNKRANSGPTAALAAMAAAMDTTEHEVASQQPSLLGGHLHGPMLPSDSHKLFVPGTGYGAC